MDLNTLKNVFKDNELDILLLEERIKVELLWNSLIFQIYKNRISINPEEIEEKLKSMQNTEDIEEYLISEILVKIKQENKLEDEINELKNKIKIQGFENVAKNFSISESSTKSGDLGWLSLDVISENVKIAITSTTIGDISEPIILPEGILIFKIRDKRRVKNNISLEDAKNQLVNFEKTKILQMYSLSHYDKLRRSTPIKFFNE